MKTRILTLIGAAALIATSAKAIITPVGVELALLVDVSSSISNDEYVLQKNGYVSAFQNAGLQALIAGTPGGVAVSYIEFATNQETRVNWTHLTDAASANNFAAAISALARLGSGIGGLTEVAESITYASNSIQTNDFEGVRKVIDVSGDGKDNRRKNGDGTYTVVTADMIANNPAQAAAILEEAGDQTRAAADQAILDGITQINGLPIIIPGEVDNENLDLWYSQNVLAGTTPFLKIATSFNDISGTILEKLTTEIDIPDPVPDTGATAALLGFGLLALGAIRRRLKS